MDFLRRTISDQQLPLWCDMRLAVGIGILGAILLPVTADIHSSIGLIPISTMLLMIGLRLIRLQYSGK
jgi:hypothetical protein